MVTISKMPDILEIILGKIIWERLSKMKANLYITSQSSNSTQCDITSEIEDIRNFLNEGFISSHDLVIVCLL